MAENREEILADFQACTGIEDVADAFNILEENNWDLLTAVNKFMPQDGHSFNSSSGLDVEIIEEVRHVPSSPVETATVAMSAGNSTSFEQPSTSKSARAAKKLLHFSIHFLDRTTQLEIADTETVGDIKQMLHTQLGVPPCQQVLTGWPKAPKSNDSLLSTLRLSRENILFLERSNSNEAVPSDDESDVSKRLSQNYTLNIRNDSVKKSYALNFPGVKTVLGVKTDVYSLTDIPVRYQVWSGWPQDATDDMMIALSGIAHPTHDLTVKKIVPAKEKVKSIIIDLADSDSSAEEFEDATESFNVEDDMFVDNVQAKKMEPLIPENVEDETIGCIHFSEQFTARFGPVHPAFFTGTLDDALKEACQKPARERKILALYLHHDGSVLSNVFCTQLLGFESVMHILEKNFVLWGWDLTFQSNKNRLQASMGSSLGVMAANTIRSIPTDKLPAIIVIMKIRSSTEIFTVIQGAVGVSELLTHLVEAVEVFSDHQRVEIREEDERAARELVKWEQDQAYQLSLEADRAKEEAKRQQLAAELEQKRRAEREIAEEKARKEAYRLEVEASLQPEPTNDCGDGITKIRFRLPKGENMERKFLTTAPLKVILDFLTAKGYPTEDYKVISSWPRRDLTTLDSSKTLMELQLCPQETVILEER